MIKKTFKFIILASWVGALCGFIYTQFLLTPFRLIKFSKAFGYGTASTNNNSEFFGPTLNVYLENVYIWSIGIAGLLAIIMLMYAGYQYSTSQGNPEQINQAKEIIVGSLAGLVLLIIAALVVQAMGLGV